MSNQSEFFPATLALRVEYADQTQESLYMNTAQPVTKICDTAFVPHCSEPTVTVGEMKHYRKQVTMVPDAKRVFDEHGSHPPLPKRIAKERYKNAPPLPGSIIGFINFKPFYYAGKANPTELVPDMEVDVFLVDNALYVTTTTAIKVLYEGGERGGPLTSYSKDYFRQLLYNDEQSFSVKHRPDDPYDILLLVKLLNIVHKKTTSVTCIATSTIDRYLALSGCGVTLDWEVVGDE